MKKIIYTILCGAALMALPVSCDILDQSPSDQYTDAQLWNDDYLLESHLAQLYAMCPVMINDALCIYNADGCPLNINFGGDFISMIGHAAQGEGPAHSTTIADEARYSGRGAQTNYNGMKMYGLQRNSDYMRWWDNAYYLNRQLNFFITNIEQSTLKTAELRQAEARFIRAFNYFAMVKRYGGVPLIKKVTELDSPDEEFYPKRDSEQACYDFIIQECLEIAEILEPDPPAGRASRWAALTLASRAALYAGSIAKYGKMQLDNILGIPADKAPYYYDIAMKACQRIKTESGHGLYRGNADKVQNLRDIFLVKDNMEAIMVKRHTGLGGEKSNSLWSWDMCMCPKPNAWSVGWYSNPYYDFVEKFEFKDGRSGEIPEGELLGKAWSMDELIGQRDARVAAWFWTNGTPWPGAIGEPVFEENTISMFRGIKDNGTYFFNETDPTYKGIKCYGDQMAEMLKPSLTTGFGVMKYLDPNADNSIWFLHSTTDYQIFRYAEVLLNYAEACVELGQNLGDALDAINDIRDRAGVKKLSSLTIEDVRNERMRELCFENHRYWDLRRWRLAKSVLDDKPHKGITFVLDWQSYEKGEPKFWIELEKMMDDWERNPVFPESNYYFPIGDGTIAANNNLVENPGYAS